MKRDRKNYIVGLKFNGDFVCSKPQKVATTTSKTYLHFKNDPKMAQVQLVDAKTTTDAIHTAKQVWGGGMLVRPVKT